MEKKKIWDIQWSLTRLGYDLGYLDGSAGKKTLKALNLFIEENNLKHSSHEQIKSLVLKTGKKVKSKNGFEF